MARRSRALAGEGHHFCARYGVTLLGDDPFGRQPFAQALEQQKPFILACKPSSHAEPCRRMSFPEAKAALGTKGMRRWLGDPAEIEAHRYANEIPLRTGPHALPAPVGRTGNCIPKRLDRRLRDR